MMIPILFDHVFCVNKGHKCPNSKAQDINGPFIVIIIIINVSVFFSYNSPILPLQLVCTHFFFFFFWYVLIEVYELG